MASDRQKDVARHRSTSGIAVVSAIAVALGTAAIIPGVYSQGNKAEVADIQQVADAEYTGGIRGADGKGAIEPAQQLASDIGSGSCTVNFSGQQGSKGGFSFNIQEPSRDSNNKRTFGANVKMDASQDRTWRDFLVLGSNNNALVQSHTVAAAAPGDSILGEDITHSTAAVMSIGRPGPRGPLTATIAADLSADDIAEAATKTGVSYGWKDTYTQDNISRSTQIFNDPDAQVSFNPWPSENDNCSAISVDWVPKEKLVIRPGEELKVGHINADANSMPRMVAEAYDAQGKYIGSSNTTASGGEQKLRIDDNGDIFYTVPKYKGTKLSAQQGTRFNVVAQPRTVQQLRDAIPTDDFGQVFEESNGPERYSKPNVISGHQWSLDDTQFHNPEYNPAQQAILSGVDSENGPVATGPQSVTFQQTGDKIADLMKKRDEGGVEAEVKLDTRYVYTGWKATLDPNTHEVTVTAPPNPAPGTFAQPRVIVTYTNGSQDIIPLLVVVDPNNTQVTNLTGPGLVQGAAGKPMTGSIDFAPAMEGHDPVKPTSFDVDPDTVPDGWKVEVKDDGTITVTATSPEDAANNSKITPKITARYPDGTTDTVEATFQVTNNVKVPDYTAVTGKAKEEVKLQPAMPKIGLGGNADDEEPNRYTFPDGSLEYTTGDWTVTIDENTGELTSTIPDNALPGAQITVPVKAYYKSGANPQITTGAINVIGDGTGEDAASYPPQVTKAGTPVSSEIKTQLSDPKLGKYKLPDKLPPNWTFSIDENGTVTATPDKSVPNGSTVSIPVAVTYPDGSTAKVPADFTVVDSYSSANSPSYPTVTGKPGTSVTSTVNRAHLSDAAEPKFSIITDPKDPSYIAPPRNLKWEDVKIDPDTGEITTPISKNALPGSSADIPVRVTYKDGSSNSTIATVVVVARQNQVHEPQYRLQTTTPGQAVDSLITDETKVPERDLDADPSKRYSVPEDVSGWKISVDENGVVSAAAPEDAKPGDGVDVPVTVTYLDGSTDTVWAPFKVKSQQKDIHEPSYQVESTKPGTEVKRTINLNNAPDKSTFSFGDDENGNPVKKTEVDGWTYEVNPNTGEVAVTPPAGAKPGDKHIHNVTVTYPDGSTDQIPVGTVVNLTNNYEAEPSYPTETIYPGDTVTAPLDLNLAEGVQLAPEEKKPFRIEPTDSMQATGQDNEFGNPTYFYKTANGNWIVGLDKDGNVIATAPETAKPGDLIDVPVIVTYADGSKDTVTAPINVKEAPTREVPFDVEYKYDDTVPQGTYKVEKEGEPGAEIQTRDGKWKQTKAPVNEIVVIGTKPAKASDEMTWTMQTGFDTITRPNPQLKPGEVKVVQEGEPGERTISVKFDATLEQGGVPKVETTSDTQTKDPKPRIVEYGPGLEDQELTFTDKNRIPFETEIVYDPSLKAGEQVVDQKGEVGEETVTTTQKLVDGKPSGDPVVTKEQTKAPVKQIIRVGGKTEGQTSNSVETEVPYGVKIEYDPTIPAGESKVATEGKPGKKTITVTQKVTNSNPDGEATVEEKVTEEPVDQVIKVGTKQATASDKVEWTEPIPFGTTVRPNPDLAPGETKVVQEGKNGEASYAATFTGTNGEANVTESKARTEPVERIVEYGPQAEDTTVVTKTEKPVPFETKIVFDDTLKAGEQVVDKQGELGAEVETSTQKIVDGKPSGEPTVTTERTKEPTNAVIRVGTKTEGQTSNSVETEVPFGVKIEYDPTIPAGESKTVTEGKPGKKTITVTQKVTNSNPDGEATVEEKVTEQPVDQVIKVGIKPAENSEKAEWTVPLPYSTTVRVNPDLKPGETRVVQKGENGEKSFTAIFRSVGDESYVVEGETTKEPVEEIIEYGPQAEDTSVVTKTEKPVP
ncbi:G5 domain-containing protein, partial [Corynebacterium sp. HMSC05E07]|uniref:G5 domain-containing protein n=1 Tax=Corynebacterium sp. HMSC05E07 TaxID=1581117 RepID=UPI0008BC86A9